MNNIPSAVVKVLTAHGPVSIATFAHEGAATVYCAPFEDVIHLFVSPGSQTEKALLQSTQLTLSAKGERGEYQIRMEGRAHAGRPLGGHPLLRALEPWCPEGVSPNRLLAVPFVAEHIEFVRGDVESPQRNAGLTPAGQARPHRWRTLAAACFSGMARPLGVWVVAWTVLWFGAQGTDFVGRPLGVSLSLVAGLGLLGGVRLIVLAQGFLAWRLHKASASDGGCLVEGLLSPKDARLIGAVLLFSAVTALSIVGLIWGERLFWMVFLFSGVWLCAPAWVAHLTLGRPEPQR
jgi:hypothetical protein